ncbi:MFS transporter [Sporolactobacillus sp. Y61]|jgi:MFS family permease|uniref:MFS transporter n=1 Tax=Sporolactobacillus sp. Y61 TaxID=3160863 RepID=A0AAU8IE23_9BACL
MTLAEVSEKQIKKAVTSDFVGSFSSSLFNFAISLYILKLTGSAMNFGTTLLIGPLIGILFSPVIGYVADHFDNKRVMIISQTGCALLLLLYSVLFPVLNDWHYLMVLFIVATMGLNIRFFNITYQASVSRLVDRPFIQKLNSLEQSSVALANIAGPIAAGVMFALVPFSFFIYFEVVAEIIVILIVLSMNFHLIDEPARSESESENMWTAMKQGLSYVSKRPLILFMISGASIINFLFGVFVVGFPYLMIQVLKMGNFQYSLTEAVFSAGMVVGGLVLAKLKIDRNPIGMVGRALLFVAVPIIFTILPLLFHLNTWLSTAIFSMTYFIVAVALIFTNVPMQTYMQKTIPAQYQGRVFTIMMVGCTSLQPLGMFVYGALFQYFLPIPIILASFLCFVIISLLAHRAGKSSRINEASLAD